MQQGRKEKTEKAKKRKVMTNEQSLSSQQTTAEQKYQLKHNEYKQVLLTPCRSYANQRAHEQTLAKILRERVSELRKIFSLERFSRTEGKDLEQAREDYELSLYKIFLVLISEEEEFSEINEIDYKAIFDWLSENGLDKILVKCGEPQMLEYLIITGNREGVDWILDKYSDLQLLQIFTTDQKDQKDLIDLLTESVKESGSKETANTVMKKLRKIPSTLAKKEEELTEQINQVNLMLGATGTSSY